MDSSIRTLRLETNKRGKPNTPHHPSSARSSQKDLDAPIPKELGLPLLPVSSLRLLIAVSILECDIFHGRLEFSIFAELALHVVAG